MKFRRIRKKVANRSFLKSKNFKKKLLRVFRYSKPFSWCLNTSPVKESTRAYRVYNAKRATVNQRTPRHGAKTIRKMLDDYWQLTWSQNHRAIGFRHTLNAYSSENSWQCFDDIASRWSACTTTSLWGCPRPSFICAYHSEKLRKYNIFIYAVNLPLRSSIPGLPMSPKYFSASGSCLAGGEEFGSRDNKK